MANPTALAVREAAQTLLLTISGIGEVAVYDMTPPPWERSQGARNAAFWEISIETERRSQFAAPREFERRQILVIKGWLQLNLEWKTQDEWDPLWVAVLDVLTDHRDLDGTVDNGEPPDMLVNEPRIFRDKDSDKLCHHCQIQMEINADLQYAAP